MTHERIVVSVGGSLIVPDAIATSFLTELRALILKEIQKGKQFAIITGGGKTARRYQEAAHAVYPLSRDDLDWLGIHATRLNAQLVRNIFNDVAHPRVIKDPTLPITATEPVIVAAGWKPGCSTDYDAVIIAHNIGAQKIVNLSNIDYIYTADPKKDPGATPIFHIGWGAFRKLIPDTWDPGLSSPFDPIAAREAEKFNIEVASINGEKLPEFEKYLAGEAFIGTIISPDKK